MAAVKNQTGKRRGRYTATMIDQEDREKVYLQKVETIAKQCHKSSKIEDDSARELASRMTGRLAVHAEVISELEALNKATIDEGKSLVQISKELRELLTVQGIAKLKIPGLEF